MALGKSLADVAQSVIQSKGLAGQAGLAAAYPKKRLTDTVVVTLTNNKATDVIFGLLKNESMNYPAGTVFEDDNTVGAEFLITANTPGALAGMRNFFKKLLPFVCGFSVKIGDSADDAQFSKEFLVLDSDGNGNYQNSLKNKIIAAETGNSQEQILRVVEWWGGLHDLRDFAITVKANTVVTLTLNIVWYQSSRK